MREQCKSARRIIALSGTLNRLIRLLRTGRGNQQDASLAQSEAAHRAIAITWLHLHSHESAHSASATYQSKPPKCVPHQASNLSWHATASPESTWCQIWVNCLRSVSTSAAAKEKKKLVTVSTLHLHDPATSSSRQMQARLHAASPKKVPKDAI